jgi:hypothetical protein
MKPKPFVSRVRVKYALIEEAMNDLDKKRTGLSKLNAEQLAALNEWLDKNAVLSPGHTD